MGAEEAAQGGEGEAQQEKDRRDAQHKEEGVEHNGFAVVGDRTVLIFGGRSPRQIPDVDGQQRDDAGRKEGEDTLQKYDGKVDAFGAKQSNQPPYRGRGPGRPAGFVDLVYHIGTVMSTGGKAVVQGPLLC